MAKLVQLGVAGIRSFGPYDENFQRIKFTSPVTLIVGQNGCGKTTIIECIRYACTEDLPSNSDRGKHFVHNPKISGTSSTKGLILLRIMDPKNNEVTVQRIVELTQKQKQMSFSSKAATIKVLRPDGTEDSLSGRCGDITSHCCELLNVSPSVLNNVIFCHQENSAWPLDEGKKLKEKFDEIFDAKRFNMCIESLRNSVKERDGKKKILKNELAFRRQKKDEVASQKRKLSIKENELTALEGNIIKKETELEPVNVRITEICDVENTLAGLQTKLASKDEQKKGILEQQNIIKNNVGFEMYEGNDEALQRDIEMLDSDHRKDENLILEMDGRRVDIENKSKEFTDIIQKLLADVGKFNQEKIQNDNVTAEKKKLVEKSRSQMNILSTIDCDLPENSESVIEELNSALIFVQVDLQELISSKENEQSKLQKAIDDIRVRKTSYRVRIDNIKQDIADNKQKVLNIEDSLDDLIRDNLFYQKYEAKLKGIDNKIETISKFDEVKANQKTADLKLEIKKNENELTQLDADYKILQENNVTEGKIESEEQSMKEKLNQIDEIKKKLTNRLELIFDQQIPQQNLKKSVENLQNNLEVTVTDLTRKINNCEKEIVSLETNKKIQESEINNLEKELKVKEGKVSQICKGKKFHEILNSTFEKREQLQKDRGQFNSAKIIYERFLEEFEKDVPCCPVCMSNFSGKSAAVREISKNIRNKISKFPEQVVKVETELKQAEDLYGKLQQLKGINDDIDILAEVKLPLAKETLLNTSQSLSHAVESLETLQNQLVSPREKLDVCRNIISTVSLSDQYEMDIENCRNKIEYFQAQLRSVNSRKSRLELENEIEDKKNLISNLRKKLEAETAKITLYNNQMQEAMKEQSVALENVLNMQKKMNDKSQLETEKKQLEEKIEKQSNELSSLEVTLKAVTNELQIAESSLEEAINNNKELLNNERQKATSCEKTITDIEKLQQQIDNYHRSNVEEKLANAKQEIQTVQNKIKTLDVTKNKIVEMLQEKREKAAKIELKSRILQDNVTLREKHKLENQLTSEIEQITLRIGGYNYRTIREEKQRLIQQVEQLQRQINEFLGQKRQLAIVIDEVKKELEKPENKEAHNIFMSKSYELYVIEKVIQDLNNYINALEKAIILFHKTRMTDINRTIREYWRNIYRGNDIDYIEIKTEHQQGTARKRSYNYKVVQCRKGVELDMRGQCSAGQRVLACLIIRMAIAETLSVNCGILALDEPTTNLDKENIESLCAALERIIEIRRSEKNFQLIIITHDEDFLNILNRTQSVPYYYRLVRNEEGLSQIIRETKQ